jgi:hypothetical protein
MSLLKPLLRFLTVLSYFLPFSFFLITCNNGEAKIAYNQAEADKIAAEQSVSQQAIPQKDSTIEKDSLLAGLADDYAKDTTHKVDVKREPLFSERLEKFVVAPTDSSLSGLGSALYYKNIAGRIFIAISILLSLLYWLFYKWLLRKSWVIWVLVLNLFSVLAFIITCFLSEVTPLYGIWVLFVFLLIQGIPEFLSPPVKK